ncbi:hypothetical protein N7520_003338 [Penicillium odoratum]|uniref:uncharacterized protein n=1 Tax=Penicillium odoratum TaxID=1167516 RepID=UPI002549B638|nr:uncharacterized protein N7520_003338 [Penicillium odoratum]KAJ5768779.1 hypothetical protein N7520_003338 [Penicillium odoratum]
MAVKGKGVARQLERAIPDPQAEAEGEIVVGVVEEAEAEAEGEGDIMEPVLDTIQGNYCNPEAILESILFTIY